MKNHICLICILFQISAYAQSSPGARSISLGSAGAALQDVWSLQLNPAGIANIEKAIFAVGYVQHFTGTDLYTQSAGFALPLKQNVVGVHFKRYGFKEYLEQEAGVVYSRKFGNSLFLAIGFNYHYQEIKKYGSAPAFSVEAGIQYKLTDKLLLGSHISNPNNSRFNDAPGSEIPVVITFGLRYKFKDKVLMVSDIQKVLNDATDVKWGLEYKLITWFSLRCGISANPFRQYSGFGLNVQRLCIDAAVSSHPNLGMSPQLALSYEF